MGGNRRTQNCDINILKAFAESSDCALSKVLVADPWSGEFQAEQIWDSLEPMAHFGPITLQHLGTAECRCLGMSIFLLNITIHFSCSEWFLGAEFQQHG